MKPTKIEILTQLCTSFLNPSHILSESSSINWEVTIANARMHRVIKPFAKVILEQGIKVPNEIAEELKEIQQRETFKMLSLTREVGSICNLLKENSIEAIPLKGPIAAKQIYSDFTAKNSRDIDILVRIESLENTILLIEQQGYSSTYDYQSLSAKQKRAFQRINNQLTFFHPQKRIQLEIHWSLFANMHLLPITFDELVHDHTPISVGENIVLGLSSKHLLFYLCSHGAKHHWSLLYWLLELASLIKKENYHWETILKEAIQLGIDRPLVQGHLLMEHYFGVKAPEVIKRHYLKHKVIQNLVSISIEVIDAGQEELKKKTISNYWQILSYKLKLRKEVRYKLSYFNFLSINDFSLIQLPDSLFFLYYVLRPIFWSKRYLVKHT